MSEVIYARVENGQIVEYPVYPVHIETRAHPFDWYTPVQFAAKPTVTAQQMAVEVPKLVGKEVIVDYVVQNKPLEVLLREVWNDTSILMTPTGADVATPVLAEIDPALLAAIVQRSIDYIQLKLDQFAQSRGYDGILSAASYDGSTDPVFAAEGAKAKSLRDQLWRSLATYNSEIAAGTRPPTRFVSELDELAAILTWE